MRNFKIFLSFAVFVATIGGVRAQQSASPENYIRDLIGDDTKHNRSIIDAFRRGSAYGADIAKNKCQTEIEQCRKDLDKARQTRAR